MFCPNCGNECNTRFCTNCGTPMQAPSAAAPTPAYTPEAPVTPAYTPETPVAPAPQNWQPQPTPEAWQPQPAPQNWQPQPAYQPGPAEWQQPQPAPQARKKGGKKAVLFIILGAVAALLIAGLVILLVNLKNDGGETSGSFLYITTRDGSRYRNDENGFLAKKGENLYGFTPDYSVVLVQRNEKFYRVENGKENRVGGSNISVWDYERQKIAWVLYKDKKGDTYLFRNGKEEDLLVYEKTEIQRFMSSTNGKYLACSFISTKGGAVIRVNLSSGEVKTIFDDREVPSLQGIDDNGCVYYTLTRDSYVSNGKDEVELDGITSLAIMDDILVLRETDWSTGTYTYYTRSLGMRGDLKPLKEELSELLQNAYRVYPICPVTYGHGYTANKNGSDNMTSLLLVEFEKDLYIADLKSGKVTPFMENLRLKNVDDIMLTEDRKTAYVIVDNTLYKLTEGKDSWEHEQLTKRFKKMIKFYENGLAFTEKDGTVVTYDGRNTVSFTEVNALLYDFDVSDDMKSIAYLVDDEVMYIRKEGEKPERLARDNINRGVAVFRGYVYYINEDQDLVRVKPGKEPEIVLEDVDYFTHVTR